LLTGSIQGTKNNVKKFLDSFERYNWLWKQKIDESLKRFNSKNPQLEDFEAKLKEFVHFEDEINLIGNYHQIGALNLKSESVKLGLKNWIVMWKKAFSNDLHKKAKTHLESLTDDIKQIRLKIEKPVKDIDSLGSVMYALEEIRKKESEIELQFRPVTEMYALLETYLPEVMVNEESDVSTILDKDWAKLVVDAELVRNQLQTQ
jgi:dynein heavy chain